MESKYQTDEFALTLVEQALTRPEDEREPYLRAACGADAELFARACSYIQWEKRMQGFLLDPLDQPSEDQPPFEPGQILIHRFHVIRKVDEGGMAWVWEAYDEKLDRHVALKCAKEGCGKQLPPEVRNAREIAHPNVCKIYEIHTASTPDGEVDFISMEFLQGENLANRIHRSPLSSAEARIIAEQLCAGLAEAHRNHVIHGDLKTNNVILTKDADGLLRAVIADFGLARHTEASGRAEGGTLAYMAPELWQGERPSVASDIYALGVMLWELRYGRPPSDLGFASSTLLLGEQVSWRPPTGHGAWNRIIARCLQPDPARRFPNATSVANAFQPSRVLKGVLLTAVILFLAAVSGWITYKAVTSPAEFVRVAVLPIASAPGEVSLSGTLLRSTTDQLTHLKGTPQTSFTAISLDNVISKRVNTPDEARVLLGATHALRATLERQGESILIHAYLTDLRSGVDARDMKGLYKPQDLHYAPTALIALVTSTLHLPPPAGSSQVNAAARPYYLAGLAAARRDSGVDEALLQFRKALSIDSGSALTYAGLAEAQWIKYAATREQPWLDRAQRSVADAETRNPDLPEVHRIAGLLKRHSGWYEQAISDYQRAIELEPKNGDAYRRLGRTYADNNQLAEAQSAFQKAVEVDPKQYRNESDLGDFFYRQADYEQAAKHLAKAAELQPNEPRTHYGVGVAYLGLGQFALAERELRSSLRLHESSTTLDSLAVVLLYQSKDREAIPYLLRALKLGPGQYLWWTNLGTAYRRIGRPSESQRAYRRALDVTESEIATNPRNGSVRAYLAYLSVQVGDRRRAESELTQAIQQAPNDEAMRWAAALTYEALGRRDAALSVLAAAPPGVIADLGRWPDVADLRADPRFKELLKAKPNK